MKMQLNSALILASVLALSTHAQAQSETQSAETTAKTANVVPNAPAKAAGEADVDDVITNRKLRAETGSKSKYSFSTAMTYNGGTVENPGAASRPNISTTNFDPARASLAGTIGGKYKISALQSISGDVGVKIYTPFHSGQAKSFRDRTTVADPSATYTALYQAAGIQNVTQVGLTLTTDSVYRDGPGTLGTVAVSQTAMYDFGGSIWSIGLAGEASYSAFDKDHDKVVLDDEGKPYRLGKDQGDFGIAIYPLAEVNISDKLNLRTVFRPWIFEHNRSMGAADLQRAPWTQSVGVGIAVTRDLYLYPNVQFQPLELSADRTNVALSMNLNI